MSYTPAFYNVVSTANSTSTPLNAAATFTGSGERSNFPDLMVTAYADQDGVLFLDFSNDNANWTTFPESGFAVTASINEVHTAVKGGRYFRARFTNTSASNQTILRLQTQFGVYRQINAPANAAIQQDADSLVVRAIEFNLGVAESKFAGMQTVFKDGINLDIDSGSVPEDIWFYGGTCTGFPITAAAAEVVSTDAGDTGTLYYSYLASDTSTSYVTESVTLNGTTPVALGHNIWRCNYMYYDTGNDTTFNIGSITLYHTATPANVFAHISAGYSQTFCAAYTVPYGYRAYLYSFTSSVRGSASASVDGFIWWRPYGMSPQMREGFNASFGSPYIDNIGYLLKVPGRTDIMPRITYASANNLAIQASYRIVIVKD